MIYIAFLILGIIIGIPVGIGLFFWAFRDEIKHGGVVIEKIEKDKSEA